MRNSTLVAATLALLLAPSLAMAQGPHWIFEVPVVLETINQNVDQKTQVLCAVLDDAPSPGATSFELIGAALGIGESGAITLNQQGSFTGTTMASVTATQTEPGAATHYACWLYLNYNEPGPDQERIEHQPRSGTELVSRVTGTLP